MQIFAARSYFLFDVFAHHLAGKHVVRAHERSGFCIGAVGLGVHNDAGDALLCALGDNRVRTGGFCRQEDNEVCAVGDGGIQQSYLSCRVGLAVIQLPGFDGTLGNQCVQCLFGCGIDCLMECIYRVFADVGDLNVAGCCRRRSGGSSRGGRCRSGGGGCAACAQKHYGSKGQCHQKGYAMG
ncbi:hypothetical protein SDC9_142560 [bioreactor metagenome]|uniref:Uncharacterized protein n=1 Tax=bioreactor metagenome TaxID=1076179 RepID=A0A645E1H0_9ZZZZ